MNHLETPGLPDEFETPTTPVEPLPEQPDIAPQPGRPVPQISNPVHPDPSPDPGPGPVIQPGTTVIPTT